MFENNRLKLVFLFIILFIISFLVVDSFLTKKIDTLTHNKYLAYSKNLKHLLIQAIEQKALSTKNIALSLSENQNYKKFLKGKNSLKINPKEVSLKIKKYSNFKNVWVQLVDKDGYSRYRSWTKKKDDKISLKRKELPNLLKNPKTTSVISVGIFDMTFKTIVPIYDGKSFLGLIEVITKTNSIAKRFEREKIDLVVLADKKYKKQIKKPFTKNFIGDYYVANVNAKKELQSLIQKDINSFISLQEYKIIDNYFITTHRQLDLFGEKMGYFVIFTNLDNVLINDVKNFENFIKIIGVLLALIIAMVLIAIFYYNRAKYTKVLEKEVRQRTKKLNEATRRYRQIFEGSKAIQFLIDPNTLKILDANDAALEFYGYSREEIKQLSSMDINASSKESLEEIIQNALELKKNFFIFKHRLSNGELKDVEVYASPIEIAGDNIIYSIVRDITNDIMAQKELAEKQRLFHQQAKMASMGEMLENIAHQWRQPLSAITTASTGIKLKKEFGELDDKFLIESVDLITNSAKYLSTTIEDFRNFLKHSKDTEEFDIMEMINYTINLGQSKLKTNDIKIDIKGESFVINGYRNELTQVLLNIINNSKDALINTNKEFKLIQIEVLKQNNNLYLNIYDNAGGIDNKIIDKIFDPYFTTKHQSQGTGIGLYMSQQIITKHFDGELSANNSNFRYKGNTYFGAKLSIKLNLKSNS